VSELFDDILELLHQERSLFGEVLLCDERRVRKESTMPTKAKPATPDEPLLFDLPTPASAAITSEAWGAAASLGELDASINTCMKCSLGGTRTNFVFGVGDPKATLMLIGEAPGADEDAQGEPFVGRAGQLLNKILEAIRFKREEVYICNILKCRPPGNRKPLPEEAELCLPYLRKQVALIRPRVILCLGLTAAEYLLGTRESLGQLRGRVQTYENIPLMVTYHPAALLRNPNWKRPTWEDVQALRKLHDELVAKNPR
jgi:uracil-DNA glycosylase family 4